MRSQALAQLMKTAALDRDSGATAEAVAQAVASVYDVPEEREEAKPTTTMLTVEGLALPPYTRVNATNPPDKSPQLIRGLLRRGHVGVIVARAKSGKSWGLVNLAVSVVMGMSWLGYQCERGNVLFIDPEIDPLSLDNRFSAVCDTMGADRAAVDAGVFRWSLRGATVEGRAPTLADVAADIERCVAAGALQYGYISLVCIDSASALLGGDADENSSSSVRSFFSTCLRIARTLGAAIVLTHHEGKAQSGDRDAMARGRGSSAWSDCPDLALSLVEVFPPNGDPGDYLTEGQRAFALECAAIREFAAPPTARLIWSYPTFSADVEGITEDWKPKSAQKAAGSKSGQSRRAKSEERAAQCVEALLSHMYRNETDSAEGIPASEAAAICADALGEPISTNTLKGYVEASQWVDVYQRSKQRWAVVPAHPRPNTEGDT